MEISNHEREEITSQEEVLMVVVIVEGFQAVVVEVEVVVEDVGKVSLYLTFPHLNQYIYKS